MGIFRRKKSEHTKPSEPQTVELLASDDLMTRAEKIVFVVGFRGETGGIACNVYRVLQKYQELERCTKSDKF